MAIFEEACKEYNVPLDLALAVGCWESGFKQKAKSGKHAYGVMQLMPGTAAGLGVNRYDPRENIRGGVKLLAENLARYGRVDYSLVAYNASPGWVKTAKSNWDGLPHETKDYVPGVKNLQAQFKRLLAPRPQGPAGDAAGEK